jgi:hypothetical protein
MLGIYALSGRNLFTMTDISESFKLSVEYKSIQYDLIVDASSRHYFSGKNIEALKNEEHNVSHTLINVILKEAFR